MEEAEKDKIKELEEKINELQKKLEDERNNFLLKAAELENRRKRLEREYETFFKFSSEKLILKFLDIFDNLERALSYSEEKKNYEMLLKGIEITLSQFKELLEKEEVKPIEALNKEFDSNLHYAITEEEGDEDNKVVQEIRKGYMMKDKVIRPSLVKVSKKAKK